MKYKIVILPSAKEDLREAAKWYNNAQKGLCRTCKTGSKKNF
jgi:hypothetical protein